MRRDFSESAYQELLSLVKQVEDEKWCDLTDWFGDRWYDFEGWIGLLDIRDYVDNVNKYHKKVIDKNNYEAQNIKDIFDAVNAQSSNYQGRLLAMLTNLQSFGQLIDNIANTVSPSNGQFSTEFIGKGLKNAINTYLQTNELLLQISNDGLNSEDVDTMTETDREYLQKLLDSMGNTYISLIPNVEVGHKVEIPIGPDLTFYYEVEAKGDIGSNVDLKTVIEDQKLKIKGISLETGGILSVGTGFDTDGEGKITIESDRTKVEFNTSNGCEGSASINIGNDTYTLTIKADLDSLTVEESVTTKLENGSVTSKIGLKKDTNTSWKPLPEYVPVEVPYPGVIPEIDIDWEFVRDTAIAVGGAVVVVAAVAAVCYFAPGYGALALVFA